MQTYLAPLICLIGLLLYALAKDKPARVGEIVFFAGLLATLLRMDASSFLLH